MARGQNLLNKVYNKPLLITLDDLQPIADYLSSPERVASLKFEQDKVELPLLEAFSQESDYQRAVMQYLDINPDTMTGVLNVDGLLVNREGQMNSQCVELSSYQGLKKRFELQVAQGIKSCVLMISSGGGEAFGAWSTASYVKNIAKQNGIKLTTYVNGNACSAAYVWAAVADEVISHPMGSVGSIGVLVQLYNDSKMLENLGVQRSFVYAGGNKIPFDDEGSFTDKFISDLQKSVNKTYDKFVQHVVDNRNMSRDEVIGTQASVYDSDEALLLGLIDKIMELEDFEIEYGLKLPRSNYSGLNVMAADNSQTSKEVTMSSQEETPEVMENGELLSNAHVTETPEGSKDMSQDLIVQMSELQSQHEKLDTDYKEVVAKLATAESQLSELKVEVADRELVQRKEQRQAQLEVALGKDNENIATMLASTESLSDNDFNAVAQGLAASAEVKQMSLQELGGEGQEAETQLDLSQQLKQMAASMNGRRV